MKQLSRVSRNSVAFFNCDIQTRFASLIYNWNSVTFVAKQMAQFAKILNIPIVVTEQYPKVFGKTLPDIVTLLPEKYFFQEKSVFSMFSPEVHKYLQENQIKTVGLYGIEAHVCVQQTTLDLLQNGYEVHLLTDGISSQTKIDRSASFIRLQSAGAVITTHQSFIFEIFRSTDFPEWKQCNTVLRNSFPELLAHL